MKGSEMEAHQSTMPEGGQASTVRICENLWMGLGFARSFLGVAKTPCFLDRSFLICSFTEDYVIKIKFVDDKKKNGDIKLMWGLHENVPKILKTLGDS